MCVCIYIFIIYTYIYIYIYIYILLTSILQVIPSCYFTLFFSSRFLFNYLFLKSHAQRNIKSVINIEFLLCKQSAENMYWWTFLRGLFLLLFPTNYITVATESLASYNLWHVTRIWTCAKPEFRVNCAVTIVTTSWHHLYKEHQKHKNLNILPPNATLNQIKK